MFKKNKKKSNNLSIFDDNIKNDKSLYENNNSNKGTISGLSSKHIKILKECKVENSAKDLMAILGFTNLSKFRKKYLNILLTEYRVFNNADTESVKKENLDNKTAIIKSYIIKEGYGFFEMTIPDKPNSRNQKYRLTSKFIKRN